ncbi:Histidinol-phosphate/aromatic aminotransferase and cobyric acid decarboxylase [Butyrivibrio fibrisolvens 16/4]|nr:Histidinol-phosphate/aromatic aminotransferase and cobyric acid decarboxylase [Butyrivibrio fibrisolvens 16/4]
MQAIILAAGMGKRLKELTQNNTKCMVKVNGVTLIERLLRQLEKVDLSRIVIVTGYEGQKLVDYTSSLGIRTPIYYVDNPIFDKTNNIYSLSLAKEYLKDDDTLLFESDIIFEDKILFDLINDKRDTLALVDKYEPWMDGTCLRLDENDRIVDFISGKKFDFTNTSGCYKTVNIYKFSKHFSSSQYIPFLEAYQTVLGVNEYYEQVLRVITMLDGAEIVGKRLSGEKWYEIDDEQDLDIAETLFDADIEGKVLRFEERYGGYWRFPDMLDFCYLVNPYFPPTKMRDEMKASFDKLLMQYPSGMRVNSLLAAKNFAVHRENIVIGNGAAELIKALMETISGKIGIIRPTFEEYPNRYNRAELVVFNPINLNYSYNEGDVINFFTDKNISTLIVINPDNPTGNYISEEGIKKLIKWTKDNNINFILDESFIDFATEECTFIKQNILNENNHLFIVKSISKSYGVPGLRLGILASGDTTKINQIKQSVSIWNINSFAEFYMQICEKYKKEYLTAILKFKAERKRFFNELSKIDYIRVVPSEANYFMIELLGKYSANELTNILLDKYYILIKDLSEKVGANYIRIAIRNEEEDDRLLNALRSL